ncbi:hypothetical protein BCAR13_660032 [Paraburkholderia caribensis]|nr:hypothetical protein BCAR13_660032 [Paraburkholderia caribensis]
MVVSIEWPRKVVCTKNPAGADVIVYRRPLVKGELPLVAWRFSECDPAASQGRATQAREQRVSTVRETRRHAGFGQVNGDELAVGQREQIGLIKIGLGGRVLDQHERRKFVWAQHGYLLKGAAPALADINDLQMPLQPANMFWRFFGPSNAYGIDGVLIVMLCFLNFNRN